MYRPIELIPIHGNDQIVNAGISVVTASDGKVYSRERLKANPMDLVYSLLVMIRAHEESDTKSKRVSAAIVKQCKNWQAGTWRGKLRNGNFFTLQVAPGKHDYTVHSEAKDVTTIEAEEGETYFLSGEINMGFMAGRPNLSPSDIDAFKAAFPKLKKSKPLED